jgi:predicted RNase H-like nuclease (RuvC/YqgF family)
MQVKVLRKDQSDKENEIYEFKEMIKKCDGKNQALESTVTTLKANLKKFKVNTDTSFKKMSSSSEEERARQELFIHELKVEL